MKAEFFIDSDSLVKKITSEIIKVLKPLLSGNKEDDNLFTVESLAKYLSVSKQWVYEKVHSNEIPYYKVGKYPRFRRSNIDDWLNKREKGHSKNSSKAVRRLLEPNT